MGKYIKGVKSVMFIGGQSVSDNIKILKNDPPHIVVGTPGRISDLCHKGFLKLDKLKFFVLDECDKLLSEIGRATS